VRASMCGCLIGAALLLGCSGQGEKVMVNLHALPPASQRSMSERQPGLNVVVLPFEDRRSEQSRLGQRTHLGGGVTVFDVPDGKAAEAVAKALTEHLRQRGWEATRGASSASRTDDVTMKGELVELTANAKSRFGSTKMMVRVKLDFRIMNPDDKSSTRFAVNGSRTETVMLFEPEHLENLLNEVLRDSFDKVLTDTKVENRSLHIR
jgi:Uncharacterized lipoprotein